MAEADLEVLQRRFIERVVEIYKQGNLGTLATLAEPIPSPTSSTASTCWSA